MKISPHRRRQILGFLIALGLLTGSLLITLSPLPDQADALRTFLGRLGEAIVIASLVALAFEVWVRAESRQELVDLLTYDSEVIRRHFDFPALNNAARVRFAEAIPDHDLVNRLVQFLETYLFNSRTTAAISLPRWKEFRNDITVTPVGLKRPRGYRILHRVRYKRLIHQAQLVFPVVRSFRDKARVLYTPREWICVVENLQEPAAEIVMPKITASIGGEQLISAKTVTHDGFTELVFEARAPASIAVGSVLEIAYEIEAITDLADDAISFAMPIPSEGSLISFEVGSHRCRELRAEFSGVVALGTLSVDKPRKDRIEIKNSDFYLPLSVVNFHWSLDPP
jgi:hypothetical protein